MSPRALGALIISLIIFASLLAQSGGAPRPLLLVSYHALEQPEHWDEDLRLMSSLGIRAVRLFFVTMASDMKLLGRFLERCEQHQISVIVTLHQLLPESIVSEGLLAKPLGVGYFRWAPNIWSEDYRRLLEDYLRRAVSVCANRSCVVAYNLFNEPHYPECGMYGNALCDYGPWAVRAFRRWLSRKYGGIGALCRAWRAAYASFDEVSPPVPQSYRWWEWPSDPGWLTAFIDWRLFHEEALASFVGSTVRYLHSLDPSRPVIINEMPWFLWPQRAYAALNPKLIFEDADIIGIDIYPAEEDARWLAYTILLLRAYHPGKPIWILELNEKEGHPTPRAIACWLLTAELLGAEAIGWFEWDACFASMDGGDYGLVDAMKRPRPQLRWLLAIHRALEEASGPLEELGSAALAEPEIAVLYGDLNAILISGDWVAASAPAGVVWSLLSAGFPVAVLPEDILDEQVLSRFRVLIIPSVYLVRNSTIRLLRDWIARGGILIADAYSFSMLYSGREGVIMDRGPALELFGLQHSKVGVWRHTYEEAQLAYEVAIRVGGRELRMPAYFALERVVPRPGVAVLGNFSTGDPAILSRELGRGRIIYLATSLASLCVDQRWRDAIVALLEGLGLRPDPRLRALWRALDALEALAMNYGSLSEEARAEACARFGAALSALARGDLKRYTAELGALNAELEAAARARMRRLLLTGAASLGILVVVTAATLALIRRRSRARSRPAASAEAARGSPPASRAGSRRSAADSRGA